MTPTEPVDPTRFHEFEQAGWQRAAEHYGETFGSLTVRTIPSLLDAVGIAPGARLLDVATGPGYAAAAAAEQGALVTAIDFSPAMIDEARRRHPSLTFAEGDAEQLLFPDRSFDAVVMNFGLLHLARPEAALEQAHRVLKPAGRYGFTVWAGPDEAVGFGIVLQAIEQHGVVDVGLPAGPPFFRFSDPAECIRSLEAAGFVRPEVRRLPLAWHLSSPEGLFEAVTRGGVRTAALLRAQTPSALKKIAAAIDERVRTYQRGGGIELPMSAVLASAVKP